jgi:hypothetical protein
MFTRCGALSLCFAIFNVTGSVADPLAIPVNDATRHIGEYCTVEFVVKYARPLPTKTQGTLIFLNSTMNPQLPDNLTVVIDETAAARFSAAGIIGIDAYYNHKEIRVTGTIQPSRKRGTEIRVSGPQEIQIINANPPPDPRDVPPPFENLPDDFDPTPRSYLKYYLIVGGGIVLIIALFQRRRMKAKNEEQD